MLHVECTHPELGCPQPRCLGALRRERFCALLNITDFLLRMIKCLYHFHQKMLSTADFQWWLKVWILMQTDSFACSHLGAGPLIFIYYSPWQHVQSVCRFPPSFNFQWVRRLQLVLLSSVWIKGKLWTGSLQACKCSGMMQIYYPWTRYEKKLQANCIWLLAIILLFGASCLLLVFQTFSPSQLDREIAGWEKLHLEELMRTNKLAQKAGWRGSQRVTDGRALQARSVFPKMPLTWASLIWDLDAKAHSSEAGWAARQEISTTARDKDAHFASRIFRDGVRNYFFFFFSWTYFTGFSVG